MIQNQEGINQLPFEQIQRGSWRFLKIQWRIKAESTFLRLISFWILSRLKIRFLTLFEKRNLSRLKIRFCVKWKFSRRWFWRVFKRGSKFESPLFSYKAAKTNRFRKADFGGFSREVRNLSRLFFRTRQQKPIDLGRLSPWTRSQKKGIPVGIYEGMHEGSK